MLDLRKLHKIKAWVERFNFNITSLRYDDNYDELFLRNGWPTKALFRDYPPPPFRLTFDIETVGS